MRLIFLFSEIFISLSGLSEKLKVVCALSTDGIFSIVRNLFSSRLHTSDRLLIMIKNQLLQSHKTKSPGFQFSR